MGRALGFAYVQIHRQSSVKIPPIKNMPSNYLSNKIASSSACYVDCHNDLTPTTQEHTHAHGTDRPSTTPPNAPTITYLDKDKSQRPSYALQLCSFPWPTAATG